MTSSPIWNNSGIFSEILFEKMKRINPAIEDLELYEFRYGLDNLVPKGGWSSVTLNKKDDIERRVNSREFYSSIQIKPRVDDRIVLDNNIVQLTNMLFVGLATDEYSESWVDTHFYFDVRGFFFLHRTVYFTVDVLAHLGVVPFKQYEQKQNRFKR